MTASRVRSFVYPDVLAVELLRVPNFRKIPVEIIKHVSKTRIQLHTVLCIMFTGVYVFQEAFQLKQKVTWVEVEIHTNEAAPIPTSRTITLIPCCERKHRLCTMRVS